MPRTQTPGAATALLLTLLLTPVLRAQQSTGEPSFGEVVQVNVVNIDVVVTNRGGEPIRGLTLDDFELFEDGKPVDISHFSFIDGGALARLARVHAAAADVVAAPTPDPASAAGEPMWLVVWIDNIHSRMHDRNRALGKIDIMVRDQLETGDQVMVASYYRSLHIEQAFTLDRDLVSSALSGLETTPSEGVANDRERQRYVRLVNMAESAKEAVELVRPYAGQVRGELWGTLLALKETIEQLAGLPGRKAILYVSSGLPLKPGAVQWNAIEYKWPRQLGIHELMLFDQTSEFQKLAAFANENGVVLHTLDGSGIRAPRSSGADQELMGVPTMSANLDNDERQNHQLPLRQLADSTGGRAILNRNDAGDALARLSEEMHTYYSLGFTPARRDDDRFHRVRVKVRRQGVRLRYREGYRDKTAGARMADRLRATLAHGLEDNSLGLEVLVLEATADGPKRFQVPIQVTLPIRNLALHPGGKGYQARFRLYLAVMDEAGGMSDVLEIPATLDIAAAEHETAIAGIWRLAKRLRLREGRQKLAVGVRDELSLISAFATAEVELGDGR